MVARITTLAPRDTDPTPPTCPTGDPRVLSWAAELLADAYQTARELHLVYVVESDDAAECGQLDIADRLLEHADTAGREAERLAHACWCHEQRLTVVEALHAMANEQLTTAAMDNRGQLVTAAEARAALPAPRAGHAGGTRTQRTTRALRGQAMRRLSAA